MIRRIMCLFYEMIISLIFVINHRGHQAIINENKSI